MRKAKWKKAAWILAAALMGGQILVGFWWMAQNITVIPAFGDSGEYLELSQTFALDEYRPILYPLILRVVCAVSRRVGIAYQIPLYLFQTLASFGALLYTVCMIDRLTERRDCSSRRRFWGCVYLSLYLLTIPMMTFMNFCVLTDSLATSALLVFLSCACALFRYERVPVRLYALMAVSFFAESLLRADRLYSCLVLAVIVFLARLLRRKEARRQATAAMLAVCLLVPVSVRAINAATQTPGCNGRIQTNLDFILLDRIVWPNMTANYPYFSDEIKQVIKKKDAKTFDKHNNNVMYQMAPLVEKQVGAQRAGEMYREMAAVVFSRQPGKVLFDIGEDILAMLGTPFSSFLNAHKLCKKGDSWNITCMSSKTERLTRGYNAYYQYVFLFLFAAGLIFALAGNRRSEWQAFGRLLCRLLPFLGMSLILTLWFCLGDGAPPNDRYALLLYCVWSLLTAGLFGVWEERKEE